MVMCSGICLSLCHILRADLSNSKSMQRSGKGICSVAAEGMCKSRSAVLSADQPALKVCAVLPLIRFCLSNASLGMSLGAACKRFQQWLTQPMLCSAVATAVEPTTHGLGLPMPHEAGSSVVNVLVVWVLVCCVCRFLCRLRCLCVCGLSPVGVLFLAGLCRLFVWV